MLESSEYDRPEQHKLINDKLYFTAENEEFGRELWVADLNSGAEQMLGDFSPGNRGSSLTDFLPFGDGMLFLHQPGSVGRQLWFTDGTTAGTVPLLPDPSPESQVFVGSLAEGVIGDEAFFVGRHANLRDDLDSGWELWITDGTVDGTRMVKDIAAGSESSFPQDFTVLGDRLYFSADTEGDGRNLWTSDGSEAGTYRVNDVDPADDSGLAPDNLITFGDHLVFSAHSNETGLELWTSDGTSEGTMLAAEVFDGPRSSSPQQLTVVGDRVVFSAFEPTTGLELWWYTNRQAEFAVDLGPEPLVLSESGDSNSFEVVLDHAPVGDVELKIQLADDLRVEIDTNELQFTPENWDVPQTISVAAIDNSVLDGDATTQLTISVSAADSDYAYAELPPQDVVIEIVDNEAARLIVQPSDGATTVDESGLSDTIAVSLAAQPLSDVLVKVDHDATNQFESSHSSLLFTPDDWDVPQLVSFTGVDDEIVDGALIFDLTFRVDSDLSDPLFASADPPGSAANCR